MKREEAAFLFNFTYDEFIEFSNGRNDRIGTLISVETLGFAELARLVGCIARNLGPYPKCMVHSWFCRARSAEDRDIMGDTRDNLQNAE